MYSRHGFDMSPLQIAIDGPVAAGKGDIAARLARELHLVYIYTGAMYRALALACLEKQVSFQDTEKVLGVLQSISIELLPSDGSDSSACKVILDGADVTERITKPDTAAGASDVGVIQAVRIRMVDLQKQMAFGKAVVMEGRDIGLRVLPQAQLKIYLTASDEERAKRRWLQWKQKGLTKTLEETLEDTKNRDTQDMTRLTDPLQKLPDAWELDTTGMTQDQVVQTILDKLTQLKLL